MAGLGFTHNVCVSMGGPTARVHDHVKAEAKFHQDAVFILVPHLLPEAVELGEAAVVVGEHLLEHVKLVRDHFRSIWTRERGGRGERGKGRHRA